MEPPLSTPAEHFIFGQSRYPSAAGHRQHLPPTPARADFRRWKCRSASKGLISLQSRGELGAAVRDRGSGVKPAYIISPTKAAVPATAQEQLQEQGRGFASSTLLFPCSDGTSVPAVPVMFPHGRGKQPGNAAQRSPHAAAVAGKIDPLRPVQTALITT